MEGVEPSSEDLGTSSTTSVVVSFRFRERFADRQAIHSLSRLFSLPPLREEEEITILLK